MTYVEVRKVTHAYSGQPVLRDVSVGFEENKITVIIGRSGSGKSTLLQLINGLVVPDKGQVFVENSPLHHQQLKQARLKTGYVVQGNGLFPHLTVAENISIVGKMIGHRREQMMTRAGELMQLTGLPQYYSSNFPHELSGGEQQRVGICRALFLDPPLLLMDEPFAALDPLTRYEMQLEVLKLQRIQPRTILLVTHDMREAQKLADNIIVLEKGEVQQFASREEVLQHPANENVQRLIEASLL